MSPQKDNHDDRHTKLCAYLFGELDRQEAAELERALAGDPALREEHARLKATIATVRGAFPDPDALSDDARRDLIAAASSKRRTGILGGPFRSVLVAAAAVLLIGGVWLLNRQGSSDVAPRQFAQGPANGPVKDSTPEPAGAPESERSMESAGRAASLKKETILRVSEQVIAASDPKDAREVLHEDQTAGVLIAITQDASLPEGQSDLAVDASEGKLRDELLGHKGPGDSVPGSHSEPGPPSSGGAAVPPSPGGPSTPGASPAAAGGLVITGRRSRLINGSEGRYRQSGDAQQSPTRTQAPVRSDSSDSSVSEEALRSSIQALGYIGAGVVENGSVGFLTGMNRKERRWFDTEVHRPLTADQILAHCRRRPDETPSMMYFRFWGDNTFELTALDRLATFSADVDTASYALARNYLNRNLVPEKAQIRTEEFINYFRPDLAPPTEGVFALNLEVADSLFGGAAAGERWLLRVVLRGQQVSRAERGPQRLTFVIDTSGSMKKENRLELVKHTLRLLLTQLDERDQIAIVNFGTSASLCLPMTPVVNRGRIETALFSLRASGSTNAEAGLKLGYEQALLAIGDEAQNRVILLSDGVANVGVTDQNRISRDVAGHRQRGIYLNTVGVGLGNHNDVFLEQLADKGDGLCNYIDSADEARRALVDNFTGALIPIARDVKIQVEFDPGQVRRYRLLGYENRTVADQDFRNDAVDAGEVGAGHQVCALFEIEPVLNPAQLAGEPVPFATARVRFKPPYVVGGEGAEGAEVTEISATIGAGEHKPDFASTAPGYRRSVLVAQFAEFLRRSTHARGDSLDRLYHEALQLERELNDPDFTEFCSLVQASRGLILSRLPPSDPLTEAIDAVRKNGILRAELEELAQAEGGVLLEQLEQQNRRLEEQIRKLLEQRLRQK